MFNHLIESSSHAKEFKRRGSFLLFTTSVYLVLFTITGVVSIYAYDAHLESQSTEIEFLTFVPPQIQEEEPAPAPPRNTIAPSPDNNRNQTQSVRTILVDSATNPMNIPSTIGTVASSVPPARSDSIVGNYNADPIVPASGPRGVPGGTGTAPIVLDTEPPPVPTPTPTPAPVKLLKKSEVLNSQALSLPKPRYPQIAMQTRIQGMVSVQVLINESGNVVSAKAVSGHPFLVPEAQRAAMQAKFSPTTISGQAVKVSGVITYNFVMAN
jgi:protein TonB